MWIGRLCSQWRLSADPSYSYQSRVQHSCTIHRCITSLLPNFRPGQTQFFSVQLYFVALFLRLCKCLKCSCSVHLRRKKREKKLLFPLQGTSWSFSEEGDKSIIFLYGMYCNLLFHLQGFGIWASVFCSILDWDCFWGGTFWEINICFVKLLSRFFVWILQKYSELCIGLTRLCLIACFWLF